MRSDSPRISVVVFVLNAVSTIDRALASVTAPDQPPVELLVMDGGSTDGTLDVIQRYEDKIAYWRSYRDGNAAIALNEGVRRATRDVICLLPADDWVEPGALHLVSHEFATDADLGVLSCGTRFVRLGPDGVIQVDAEFIDPATLEFTMHNLVRCPLTAGRFILRRLYAEAGEYKPDLRMSNDLDFLIRVLLNRPKSKVLPRLVYTYRRHPKSRTLGGDPRMIFDMMRDNIRVAYEHLGHSRMRRDERRELLGLHGRASARFAWMHLLRGHGIEASRIIYRAIRLNWLWPISIFSWMGRRFVWGRSA